jgi:hypothetical protein
MSHEIHEQNDEALQRKYKCQEGMFAFLVPADRESSKHESLIVIKVYSMCVAWTK